MESIPTTYVYLGRVGKRHLGPLSVTDHHWYANENDRLQCSQMASSESKGHIHSI